ncbi:hypothetical protein C1H46_018108 [Malus baccata]|uniref:Uncharacterized protein n=1 Tax=Malus baccata TaxID=106549 RepID=A0A540MCN2_MALBA|nr:hypothetical protein C1H46_018108 [Malus baccata]
MSSQLSLHLVKSPTRVSNQLDPPFLIANDHGSAVTFKGKLSDSVEAGEKGRDDGFWPCGRGGSNWEVDFGQRSKWSPARICMGLPKRLG